MSGGARGGLVPYYDEAGITIYHGDCREVLPAVSADAIGLVLTDPPYGIRRLTQRGSRRSRTRVEGSTPTRTQADIVAGDDHPFDPSLLLRFPRLVLFGANHYADRLPPSGGWIVWDKREGHKSDCFSDCELAWTNVSESARLWSGLWRGMIRRGEENGQPRLHPAQKPVALMRWILDRWTVPGELILDPYMGSGTTLVAAYQLRRKAIGIELEERYCAIAVDRLRQRVLPLEVG